MKVENFLVVDNYIIISIIPKFRRANLNWKKCFAFVFCSRCDGEMVNGHKVLAYSSLNSLSSGCMRWPICKS